MKFHEKPLLGTADRRANMSILAACSPNPKTHIDATKLCFSSSARRACRVIVTYCLCILAGRTGIRQVGLPERLCSERFHLHAEVPVVYCEAVSCVRYPNRHIMKTDQLLRGCQRGRGGASQDMLPRVFFFLEIRLKKESTLTTH
jgi:hypothetical protein